ncbi:MAG TPA: HEAT repeat domain-containing protein [Polyangiaceae bacterium]|nr:HEAT repeat domain-containing protein [Polyangiaceae bacterium]
MNKNLRRILVSLTALGLSALAGSSSAEPDPRVHAGRAATYQHLANESLEDVSTPDAIMAVTESGIAPTRVWSVLEHGEKVECLSCIPHVGKLLYNSHPKTREIAAWWLRRRVFGVFGEGQVYSQVVGALADTDRPENERVFAANAIGEFLSAAGVKHVARSLTDDPSPLVREASAKALQRLNSQGPNGELAAAMLDSAEAVRLAAVRAALRVNVFTGVENVLGLIGDESPSVRRAAVDALGTMRVGDSVGGLMALASSGVETDPAVRQRAVWALGQIGDPAAREVVSAALDDPDQFVRDAATAALRRL